MDRESDFTDLMARAGSGDPEAIRDFLDRFEQEVRVMVRARLPRKLRPRFDSGDFVQEVWQARVRRPAIGPPARIRRMSRTSAGSSRAWCGTRCRSSIDG